MQCLAINRKDKCSTKELIPMISLADSNVLIYLKKAGGGIDPN